MACWTKKIDESPGINQIPTARSDSDGSIHRRGDAARGHALKSRAPPRSWPEDMSFTSGSSQKVKKGPLVPCLFLGGGGEGRGVRLLLCCRLVCLFCLFIYLSILFGCVCRGQKHTNRVLEREKLVLQQFWHLWVKGDLVQILSRTTGHQHGRFVNPESKPGVQCFRNPPSKK